MGKLMLETCAGRSVIGVALFGLFAAMHCPEAMAEWVQFTTTQGCVFYRWVGSGPQPSTQGLTFSWSGTCTPGQPINGKGTLRTQHPPKPDHPDPFQRNFFSAVTGRAVDGVFDGEIRIATAIRDDYEPETYTMGCFPDGESPGFYNGCVPRQKPQPPAATAAAAGADGWKKLKTTKGCVFYLWDPQDAAKWEWDGPCAPGQLISGGGVHNLTARNSESDYYVYTGQFVDGLKHGEWIVGSCGDAGPCPQTLVMGCEKNIYKVPGAGEYLLGCDPNKGPPAPVQVATTPPEPAPPAATAPVYTQAIRECMARNKGREEAVSDPNACLKKPKKAEKERPLTKGEELDRQHQAKALADSARIKEMQERGRQEGIASQQRGMAGIKGNPAATGADGEGQGQGSGQGSRQANLNGGQGAGSGSGANGGWRTEITGPTDGGLEGGGGPCRVNYGDTETRMQAAQRRYADSVVKQMEALLGGLDELLAKARSQCPGDSVIAQYEATLRDTQRTCDATTSSPPCQHLRP